MRFLSLECQKQGCLQPFFATRSVRPAKDASTEAQPNIGPTWARPGVPKRSTNQVYHDLSNKPAQLAQHGKEYDRVLPLNTEAVDRVARKQQQFEALLDPISSENQPNWHEKLLLIALLGQEHLSVKQRWKESAQSMLD